MRGKEQVSPGLGTLMKSAVQSSVEKCLGTLAPIEFKCSEFQCGSRPWSLL